MTQQLFSTLGVVDLVPGLVKGKLKLDQPIADFAPEFAGMKVAIDPGKSLESRPAQTLITVRHLLNHTAGFVEDNPWGDRQQPMTDPVALSLHHDSRDLALRSPFGAVPQNQTVRWALKALPGVQQATLVLDVRRLEGNQEVLDYRNLTRIDMQRTSAGAHELFKTRYRFKDKAIYGYWFEVLIGGVKYVYQNNAEPIYWTQEKGSGGLGQVSLPIAQDRRVRRFRITVYDPAFKVPAWAQDAVYYFIFPERFRNGNPANDPIPGVTRYHQHTVEVHKNWTDRPYRPGSGDGSDAHFNNDFFGGDLAGLIDKLDHIRELGANAIYMTPVFKAASNHKYDTADYHQIDPSFGTNADFTRLTREAAKRGIRIIPDASLNHVGADSRYFDRFGNYSTQDQGAFANGRIRADSPYANWFSFDATQAEPGKQFEYSSNTSVILADIAARALTTSDKPEVRRKAVADYLQVRLFGPLGMTSMVPEFDASGTLIGGSLMHATARDWAKLGEMLRLKGRAPGGEQLVPQRWVEAMLTPSPASPHYGFQTWLNRPIPGTPASDHPLFPDRAPQSVFSLIGHMGQYVLVSPSQRVTLVRLGHSDSQQRPPMLQQVADVLELYPAS